MSWRRKYGAGSLISAFALLIVFLVAGAPAYAYDPLDAAAVRAGTTVIVTSAAGDQDHGLCPFDEDADGPCCCHAGACSLTGCVLPVTTAITPVVFYKATYDPLVAPRPDTAATAPDLPPPRMIV
ncbi:MAG: hypothetical protein B7Z80_20070 [Rhodospirillales bacterium 20-64-7]|nr:MAG: hypothetical protein B7Z80_20070 [Rhodospirillales bacterium 20-64-7]